MPNTLEPFGETPDGSAHRIVLAGDGLTATLLTWGARVQDLRLDGVGHSLVLGADNLAPYLGPMREFGAIVGRYANRIGRAQVVIDGEVSHLDRNWRGKHTLHGGARGTSRRLWSVADLAEDRAVLTLSLGHGDMGFPGRMQVATTYQLSGGALCIDIEAQTEAPTPCSFAHHSYFNLDDAPTIDGHWLQIAADACLAVDDDLIPTGRIVPVADIGLDFRRSTPLKDQIVDSNFCLQDADAPRGVAKLLAPSIGLGLRVNSDAPGLQVYTGDGIKVEPPTGASWCGLGARSGIALETQAWPDAPNHPTFPEAVLRPGVTYRHSICYQFERLGSGGA